MTLGERKGGRGEGSGRGESKGAPSRLALTSSKTASAAVRLAPVGHGSSWSRSAALNSDGESPRHWTEVGQLGTDALTP